MRILLIKPKQISGEKAGSLLRRNVAIVKNPTRLSRLPLATDHCQ